MFDPDRLLLDSKRPRLGGKQLQRRAIAQRGFGLSQPGSSVRRLSSEDLLSAGRDARNTDSLIGFLRRQQLPGGFASVQGPARRNELAGFGIGQIGSNPEAVHRCDRQAVLQLLDQIDSECTALGPAAWR